LNGAPVRLSSETLSRAMKTIAGKSGGKTSIIPGFIVEKSSGKLAVVKVSTNLLSTSLRKPELHRRLDLRGEVSDTGPVMPLRIPGKTAVPYTDVLLIASTGRSGKEFDSANRTAYLDHDRMKNVKVRFWKRGDKIRPLGMTGHKLVSDIFIDRKIPEFERRAIPLVLSGNRIAWIAGVMISDDFKIVPKTKKVLKIKLCEPS
jgi:tRNA(Ile)-lysidine synthetase-like protein